MAILTISEFEKVNVILIEGQVVMAPQMPAINEQNLAIGGGSLASVAFDKRTRFIRVNCDIACCLAGSNPGDPDPVAVANFHRLGPNESGFYGVLPQGKIAVIASPT